MSARYSKTSSRGRSMLIVSSRGSTAPGVLPASDANGALVLGRAHELGALRGLAAARAAELADDPLGVQVDPLADQRGAVAVDAAGALAGELLDALAQQRALEAAQRPRDRRHGFECFAVGHE